MNGIVVSRVSISRIKAQKKYLDFCVRGWRSDNVAFAYMTGILPIKKWFPFGIEYVYGIFMTEPGNWLRILEFTENEVKIFAWSMEYRF